ncbi:MAG TPA: hypothetical protein DC017_05200 [Candidatus Wallbacteria bacterium]|nr:hypothetical protein [Candidatus Wallbacteria bacterium]
MLTIVYIIISIVIGWVIGYICGVIAMKNIIDKKWIKFVDTLSIAEVTKFNSDLERFLKFIKE